jgi:hypothetical protein
MNIEETANTIVTILRNNSIELGISQEAIFILGENSFSVAIPEYISIAVIPKESISLENFETKFWKCSIEITVISPTFFRCFEIVQMIATILQKLTTISLSQNKIHKHQSTVQSTTMQFIAQTIIEVS